MDLNLDTLKREILEYLDAREFAVFRSSAGALEGIPMVLWDCQQFPDYQLFLEAARKSGVKLILFAAREFEESDVDDLLEQVDECELSRDDQREYQARLRRLRIHTGVTCSLELAFNLDSRLYVYEMQPDWYEEFMTIEDELISRMTDEEELGGADPLGGYFSKN